MRDVSKLVVVAVVACAVGCGPMFDSPTAPEPAPWVLPSPGPSPCPLGFRAQPALDRPLVCAPPR